MGQVNLNRNIDIYDKWKLSRFIFQLLTERFIYFCRYRVSTNFHNHLKPKDYRCPSLCNPRKKLSAFKNATDSSKIEYKHYKMIYEQVFLTGHWTFNVF